MLIARVLLEIVADKTGYPADMLELDMRLDTDLGIDSIKRVEIFSAIQDRLPDTPPAGPDRSGPWARCGRSSPFWTVVMRRSRSCERLLQTPPAGAVDGRHPAIGSPTSCWKAVAEKTGYPIDMLELDMRLDADLGIDSIKRVEILSAVQERLPQRRLDQPRATGHLGRFGRSSRRSHRPLVRPVRTN